MDDNIVIITAFILAATPVLTCLILIRKSLAKSYKKYIEQLKAEGKLETLMEKPQNGLITVNEEELVISFPTKHDTETHQIRWDEINQIIAYKRDCFGHDLICWDFVESENHFVTAHEEMVGYFHVLLKALEERFGITNELWYQTVVVPAFATNETLVWQRADEKIP